MNLDSICDWTKRRLVTINPNKTKCMAISSKPGTCNPMSRGPHVALQTVFCHPLVRWAELYKSLIRPMMEYADVIWSGCNEDDSELIESV